MCGCRRGGAGGWGGGIRDAGGGIRDVGSSVIRFAGGGSDGTRSVPTMSVPAVGGAGAGGGGSTRKRKLIVPLGSVVTLTIVDTAMWGPPMWRLLHYYSIRGPTAAMTTLLTALQDGIPCPECTAHYRAWFAAHPVTEGAGVDIVDWVLALHNDVNARRGTGVAWTMAQVQAEYGPGGVYTAVAAGVDMVTVRPLMGGGVVAALEVLAAA